MIDISIFQEKLDSALKQKGNEKYKDKIEKELNKSQWQEELVAIEEKIGIIKNEDDFKKYQKNLIKLFDDLYEVITAPGVDDFIGFLNNLTNESNNSQTTQLRKYLVDNYKNNTVSESIDSILSYKSVLDNENSIFSGLLKEVTKELKKTTLTFLKNSKEFENSIEIYFDELIAPLQLLNETDQISYEKTKNLYTKAQIENNIEFYEEIIELILKENQKLKNVDDTEKTFDLNDKITRRILAVNKCINLLDKSGIANSKDTLLQRLFLRFKEDMATFSGGINENLEEFLDNKWAEIETKYQNIKLFFDNKHILKNNPAWESYQFKGELNSVVLQYNALLKENILNSVLNAKSPKGVQQMISSKSNEIDQFNLFIQSVKHNILIVFKTQIEEYDKNNVPLLKNLSTSKQNIKIKLQETLNYLDGLKNGLASLEESEDFIDYLIEDFHVDLISYNGISSSFREALEVSGMTAHLDWLEKKLNGTKLGILESTDFNNQELIRELLAKGLIQVEIQKNF